jgi:hypothetical protein
MKRETEKAQGRAIDAAVLSANESEPYGSSAINIKKSDWKLLRRVAEARADKHEGRSPVSAVIQTLIDANRKKLEAEIKAP